MAELRRQLTYKCRWYGSTLVVADTFYPSSKTCSACGRRKLSREWPGNLPLQWGVGGD